MRGLVVLDEVHALDAAGPRGKARGTLSGASIALDPGVHAVLGAPEDGTLALMDVLTGARAPRRGKVTVAGRDPSRTAFVRARIGALGAEPRLLPARTVRDAVRAAMRARGETGDRFDAVIDPLGLSHLHGRDPRALSFAEERAVELALALSTPAPLLVALHEPLAEVAIARSSLVAARLRELAAAGACVIVVTSSPADARALAETVFVLHRGAFARAASADEGLGLPAPIELVVWTQHGARELAAALSLRPEVTAVAWEAASPASAWPGASAVRVRGGDADACALAVTEAVVASGVEIEGIERRSPALGEVRAATEALWRMARQRAAAPPVPAPVVEQNAAPAEVPVNEAAPTPAPAPEAAPAPEQGAAPAVERGPTHDPAPPAEPGTPAEGHS